MNTLFTFPCTATWECLESFCWSIQYKGNDMSCSTDISSIMKKRQGHDAGTDADFSEIDVTKHCSSTAGSPALEQTCSDVT